ncbi:rubber cis-polyprenyltransferase HRT2 [Prunus yedoensis var. nudiflora]|uniref:Rubber cis-polyprenyltransferase HRT2 n=1 Tax=Prunus yedoensis var. nudiflora TaxID=2094558 RepID=A0A314ZR42_PRUYE|nr:rubber cis-polyprenyltransferase HRT2 [Prunus yedoensis var. nudiflora]
MEKSVIGASQRLGGLGTFLRKCMFSVVSVGPIPEHIAFIMDGNRRYAKRRNLPVAEVYAFSIDNFKRRPEEVQTLMDLLQEKIEVLLEKESIVNQYGIRVYFIGNLKLLNEPVRVAAEKAMKATANNSKAVLLICVAYTSCDEIVHAVQESCNEKRNEIHTLNGTKVSNGVIYGVEKGEKINGVMECDVHKSCNGSLDGEAALDTSKPCSERNEAVEKENTTVNHVEKDKGDEVASRICNGLIEDVQEKRSCYTKFLM